MQAHSGRASPVYGRGGLDLVSRFEGELSSLDTGNKNPPGQ